jgi:hypothetical protein
MVVARQQERHQARQQQGRFAPSRYDHGALVAAVADITRYACAATPQTVSTRLFNRSRSDAGHPSCPTAGVICERLGCEWPQVKELALDPDRCVDRSLGKALAEADDDPPDAAAIRAALRLAAARRHARTISGAAYMGERRLLLDADRRCYRHGGQLRLLTESQILVAAGSWRQALALAGLDPLDPARAQNEPVQILDALDLFVDRHGYVATTQEMEGFAREEDFPLARRRRRYAEEVAELRTRRDGRGEETPTERPPPQERPQFDAARGTSRRRKKRWLDEELVAAIVRGFDLLPARVRMTQENYRRHCAPLPDFPPTSAFSRKGRPGFAAYRALARRERLAAAQDAAA